MGYINSASTVTVTARLTPYGREKLLTTSSTDLITQFSLGDSDANYNTSMILGSGEVPGVGGDLTSSSGITNSVYYNVSLRNKLIANELGDQFKAVDTNSNVITTTRSVLPQQTVTGSTIPQEVYQKGDTTGSTQVNLFNTFGLPIEANDIVYFTTVTDANGGFSDTAISSLGNNDALIIAIPNNSYGDMIDGKSLKVSVRGGGITYDCYGTYQRTLTSNSVQDGKVSENATNTKVIGDNIVFLFSDDIKKPNGDTSKSWATGYGIAKPFSNNGKELFNYTTNTVSSLTADKAVGVAYLDKGFAVITDDTITSSYLSAVDGSATTITYSSVALDVEQRITCIASSGEFGTSTNPTFNTGDIPRISEIGLYDDTQTLVAIAKLDKHIESGANNVLALGVKISV